VSFFLSLDHIHENADTSTQKKAKAQIIVDIRPVRLFFFVFYIKWYSSCGKDCQGSTHKDDEIAHDILAVKESDKYSLSALTSPLFTITFLRKDLNNEHLEIFVRSLIAQKDVTFNVVFLDEYTSCKNINDSDNVGFMDRLLDRDEEIAAEFRYKIVSK